MPPGATHYRPLAFIDGDDALMLADATGVFKLTDRAHLQVSGLFYLGRSRRTRFWLTADGSPLTVFPDIGLKTIKHNRY
jgi:hypothetical protein